ncbi:hypothetical protein V1508DRAFT_400744 [Lipomyces doorenjongii]|uniref:uncharacterized protein n=1 Tax=Lipomyces doorenjongii TaxID=383834 RepID=UPI0034CDB18E
MTVYNLDPDKNELTVTREEHGQDPTSRALRYLSSRTNPHGGISMRHLGNGLRLSRQLPVISNSMPFSSGNSYYSKYHNQYSLAFFNNWIDNTFRVLSAPTPAGPWTTDNKVLYETAQGESYNYGAQSTSDLLSKYPKALKLKFA